MVYWTGEMGLSESALEAFAPPRFLRNRKAGSTEHLIQARADCSTKNSRHEDQSACRGGNPRARAIPYPVVRLCVLTRAWDGNGIHADCEGKQFRTGARISPGVTAWTGLARTARLARPSRLEKA